MNKKLMFSVLFACLLLNSNVALFSQGTNNEQRLVGSWTDMTFPDSSIVFNSNGTMTTTNSSFDEFIPTHWAAAGDKLIVYIPNRIKALRSFYISSDGRTLITIRFDPEELQEIGTVWRRN